MPLAARCARLDAPITARRAGLRYVAAEDPGYTRLRWGRGFSYRDWRDRVVRNRMLRDWFSSLAIPPAWQGVWISRFRDAHLLATGRDLAGRKQYLYHPRWRQARDREKYRRLADFGRVLPGIRARVRRDLRADGLGRGRVLAAVVRLLDSSLARVGYAEYAEQNDSYGLTTIRKRHVDDPGAPDAPILRFEGKSGKPWEIEIADRRVADVIRACADTPGWELFKFYDGCGRKRDVKAEDVTEYLRESADADVSAKDFRTWGGTLCAYRELVDVDPDAETARDPVVVAVEHVADTLNNTPAVSRSSYIHPTVIEDFEAGRLGEADAHPVPGLGADEQALLGYLEDVDSRDAA